MKCLCGGVPGPWKQPHSNVSVPAVTSLAWAAAGWGSAGRRLTGDEEFSFYCEPHSNPQILRKIVLIRKVVAGTRWFNQSVRSTVIDSSNSCPHMKLFAREGRLSFDRSLEASVP